MNVLVIFNPHSGRGLSKKKILKLKNLLEERRICYDFYHPSNPKDITNYLINNPMFYDKLILIGGDGTINEAITGILKKSNKPDILYIPNGTVNDFGNMLGLPRNLKKAISLLDGKPQKMDVCKIGNEYFSYAAAFGKFSNVSYDTKQSIAKKVFRRFYYYGRGIREIFKKESFEVIINNQKYNAFLVLILNANRIGSFKVRNKTYVDDNKIDLFIFERKSCFSFFNMLMFFVFGIHYKHNIIRLTDNRFVLKINKYLALNTDGEKKEEINACNVDIISKAISIHVPNKTKTKLFSLR